MPLWLMMVVSAILAASATVLLRVLRRKNAYPDTLSQHSLVVLLTFVQKLAMISVATGALFVLAVIFIRSLGTRIHPQALANLVALLHRAREIAEALDQRLTAAILLTIGIAAAMRLHRLTTKLMLAAHEQHVKRVATKLGELPPLPDTPAMAELRKEIEHAERVLLSYVPDLSSPVERYETLRRRVPDLKRSLARLDAERRIASGLMLPARNAPPLTFLGRILGFFTSRGFVNLLDRSSKAMGAIVLALLLVSLIGLQANGASRMAGPVTAELHDLVVRRTSDDALASVMRNSSQGYDATQTRLSEESAEFTQIEDQNVLGIARWFELTQAEAIVRDDSRKALSFRVQVPPIPPTSGGGGTWGIVILPDRSAPAARRAPWTSAPETPAGRDFAVRLNRMKRQNGEIWEWIKNRWEAGIGEFSIPADEEQLVGLALGKILSSATNIEAIPSDLRPISEELLDDLGDETGRRYARSRMLRLFSRWIAGAQGDSLRSYEPVAPFSLTRRERHALTRAATALHHTERAAVAAYVESGSPLLPAPASSPTPGATPETPPSSRFSRRQERALPAPAPAPEPERGSSRTGYLRCEVRTCYYPRGYCTPWRPAQGAECLRGQLSPDLSPRVGDGVPF